MRPLFFQDRLLPLLAALSLAAHLSWAIPGIAADPTADEAAVDAKVGELIAQLGAEDFAARERAQAELGQLGLVAFDALHGAQSHNDPEIALRARYLVRSMSVRWFQEADSPEVVRILKGYGDLADADRRSRIDGLAALDQAQGTPALCRLARFETVEDLSKYAALRILGQPLPTDAAANAKLQQEITSIVGNSKRQAAAWLRLYAKTLADPAASLADWDKATTAESELLERNPDRTNRDIVRDLYRFQVELLKRLSRDDEAVAVIRRTYNLLEGTPEQVAELVDWLFQRQAWPVVLEVADRFQVTVQDNPLLLYRVAETHLKLSQDEKAAEVSQRALALHPESLDEHLRTGFVLEDQRGLHDWAEREYREVIKSAQPVSVGEFKARFRLAEMLHDQARELPAAEALQPICDLMEKDEAAKVTCVNANRDPESVISRMHYFFAMHYHEQADAAKERAALQSAIDTDPTDADVLIAMYRLTGADDAWKKQTVETITEAAAEFRSDIDEYKQLVEMTAGNEAAQAQAKQSLALACNQYAWLVGNTVGDYGDALKMSQLSVELAPDYAGYLDTLGRCYFAKGDFENAVKHQTQAARLSPYSGQIRRQLELFQKALAAKTPQSAPEGAAKP